MKVATVGKSFHKYFACHFESCDIINRVEDLENNYDLVIFTGGEDINPREYSRIADGALLWNDTRDKLEFDVFRYIRILGGPKVLGVCRGHQLINVGLGGTLIQDLNRRGVEHRGPRHRLKWLVKTPLSKIFPITNSIHHQAIDKVGRGGGETVTILAKEVETGIIEAVVWSNKFLGVQFHPEFMAGADKFFSVIKKWVGGGKLGDFPVPKEEKKSPMEGRYRRLETLSQTGRTIVRRVFPDSEDGDFIEEADMDATEIEQPTFSWGTSTITLEGDTNET